MRTKSRRKQRLRALAILALCAILFAGLVIGSRWMERRDRQPETVGDYTETYDPADLLDYQGAVYRSRSGITTVLLMGIDKETGAARGYRNGGQADFMRLLVLDAGRKQLTQIQLDRDTMTPITVLGVLGDKTGMRTLQLGLAHGFGDGREQSCQLAADAVSNLLFGIPVDFCLALNLDGINTLNTLLGGVTVTIWDDFTAIDPAMAPGVTLTLQGQQAEVFVRSRMSIGVGTNEARMARQEEYINGVMDILGARLEEDQQFIGTLFDELSPYLVTDISRGRMINMAWTAKEYTRSLIKPQGEHVIGANGYMEFHVDEAALRQTVVDLFYDKME